MNREILRRLFAHMEWADSEVWDEVLRREETETDPFIGESLLHLHVVQRAYLTGWTGGTPRTTETDEFPSLDALRGWGRTFYPEAEDFLETLTDEDLSVKADVLWPELVERAIGRPPIPITLGDMAYQVVAHSAHHRAQVNRRIRELEGAPPFIDFVAWAWLGDPAPSWARGGET